VAQHGRTECYDEHGEPNLIKDNDTIIYQKYADKIQNNILNKFYKILALFSDKIVTNELICLFEKIHCKMFYCVSFSELRILCKMNSLHTDGFINYYDGRRKILKYVIKKKIHPYVKMRNYLNYKNLLKRGIK
jgi:hypothetical protein